jgi:hypothetical protein
MMMPPLDTLDAMAPRRLLAIGVALALVACGDDGTSTGGGGDTSAGGGPATASSSASGAATTGSGGSGGASSSGTGAGTSSSTSAASSSSGAGGDPTSSDVEVSIDGEATTLIGSAVAEVLQDGDGWAIELAFGEFPASCDVLQLFTGDALATFEMDGPGRLTVGTYQASAAPASIARAQFYRLDDRCDLIEQSGWPVTLDPARASLTIDAIDDGTVAGSLTFSFSPGDGPE